MSTSKKCVALLCFAAVAAVTTVASRPAQAASCTWVNTPDQGDNFAMWDASGWKCAQNFINYWWEAFHFDAGDWNSGFGYEAPCDNARPLARTFNSLYVLGYSSTANPHCNSSAANVTEWAMCWSGQQIDELDGRCGSGDPNKGLAAQTFTGIQDNRTELYWPFFYFGDVVMRAASIFHEARHANGCDHSGGSTCGRGVSCDFSWLGGCKNTLGKGANTYEVTFLSWYLSTAWRTTPALRSSALNRANSLLKSAFTFDPCFRMSANGSTFKTC